MPTTSTIPVSGGELPVLLREPASQGPALVIVPSIFGIGTDVVAHADHFAAQGAFVVVLDSFWRGDPGPVGFDDAPRAMARMQALAAEDAYADVLAAIAWAKSQPMCDGHAIGLGVCFGGQFVFLAAADAELNAFATWHGSRMQNHLARAAEVAVPFSLHFGGDDPVVPTEAVEAIRAAFDGRDDAEIVVYEGAGHGFSHSGGPAHHTEACDGGVAGVDRLISLVRSWG